MRIRTSVSTLTFALALVLTCSSALGAQMPQRGAAGCGHGGGGCGGGGPMCSHAGHGEGQQVGHGGQTAHHELMGTIHFLIDHHDQVVREVEEIEDGVLTTTRSPKNPELVPMIQRHVREMWALLESGGRIHQWDPLFRALFDHADQIELSYEDLDDGIRVRETSSDPEVTRLIRAHAAKVDDFVARGRVAMHEETLLPSD